MQTGAFSLMARYSTLAISQKLTRHKSIARRTLHSEIPSSFLHVRPLYTKKVLSWLAPFTTFVMDYDNMDIDEVGPRVTVREVGCLA